MKEIKPEPREPKIIRCRVEIKGTVQGVGFRPFVYNLANLWNIKGNVLNSSRGVVIEAEGEESDIRGFINSLKNNPPRLSKISGFKQIELPVRGYLTFEILASEQDDDTEALIPPDIATCKDCRNDIFNPASRFFEYPFTNCTNCGPRFTIIREVPYDRTKTSMASFQMCRMCSGEFHNPSDRRFHAQPVACPACGPQVELASQEGKQTASNENWLEASWNILKSGGILALKGLGGFHLVCDAKNKRALSCLRSRKGRKCKPFAVMCRDLETVKKYCHVDGTEAAVLESLQAPIVILEKKPDAGLPEELAPGLKSLGVMLPYTPLHLLLFSGPFDMLVMTSGNYSGLPLVKDNSRAVGELGGIADYFLRHNRDIVNRCDDSVVQVIDGETQIFRRSRGYVPRPVPVCREDGAPVIMGVGGEMKNCFCLLKKNQAFMSQYIGEISCLEGEENLFSSLINFQKLIGATPEIVACDAHPAYASARIARRIPARHLVQVQHHHAHMASCLAENGLENENVIGIILDGTGYGTDGNLWGFEILAGNFTGFRRLFHLAYVPLPGGEAAIRQPWRTAAAYLITHLGAEGKALAAEFFSGRETDVIEKIIERRYNSPLSSGCGRLFDAVSALLEVCLENTYEGQAAIELGEKATGPEGDISIYPYEIKEGVILPGGLLRGIVRDKKAGLPVENISTKFHRTLVKIIEDAVERASSATGLKKVALSGGTWHNPRLFKSVKNTLESRGYQVLRHRQVPSNDGGIALGQAMIAHWRWRENVSGDTGQSN
ncbi:MAG TPA: carbamoyltransferase HypF [Bacillota bacterium]|nr:carbamoyltransferase HypF [Bacillota bacterium]